MNFKIKTAIFALTLSAVLLYSSCTMWLNTINYDKTTNLYTDAKTGVSYRDAPSSFEPAVVGGKYAKIKLGGEAIVFYEIKGMNPRLWLTEEYGTVFYSSDISLPTLTEMEPVNILVCIEQALTAVVAEISDAQDIAAVISDWESGVSTEYPATPPAASYRLKFESDKYPGIYFSITYLEYSDGGRYLYSRFEERFVPCGDVISKYTG